MECGIKSGLKPPPRPIQCDAGDPNDKRVSACGTPAAPRPCCCAGDPGPLLPQIDAAAKVLAYGTTIRFGAIAAPLPRPASRAGIAAATASSSAASAGGCSNARTRQYSTETR